MAPPARLRHRSAVTDLGPDPDELERRWQTLRIGTSGAIRCLVQRTSPGVHATPAAVVLSRSRGVVGDRWAASGNPHPEAQITLIERRVVELLLGASVERWHVSGDNFVVDLDLSVAALPVWTRFAVGDAVIEITPVPHAGCDKFRARLGDNALRWVNHRTRRDRRLRGVHARILVGGTVRVGDRLVRSS